MARSRLTKRQQQKMIRQTLLIGLAAVGLLVAFVIFIVPGLVELAGNALDAGTVVENEDQIPPQTPILSAPPAATNSAKLPVTGFGEAGAEVVLIIDGQEIGRSEIEANGQFELDVPLTEGENQVSIYSVDEAGNESRQTRSYRLVLDTEAPSLELDQPTDGDSFELRKNQTIEVRGKTEPKAKVYLNERLVYADSQGEFSARHQLSEGENKLQFRIVDEGGNVTEKEITVQFRF